MNNKLKEKFIKDLFNIHGEKFKLIGKFTNRETPTEFLCECGNIFSNRPKDVLKKTRVGCIKCTNNKVHNKEKFINDLYDIHKDKYKLLGEFTNRETPTEFLCECGNKFTTRPKDVLRKNRKGCTSCYGNKRKPSQKVTKEEFLQRLNEKFPNNEFELVSEYKNMDTKSIFRHNTCGNDHYETTPELLLRLTTNVCNNCTDNLKTHEQFVEEINEKYNGNMTVLGNYVNGKTKILVRHKCGHEWEVRPDYLSRGISCPNCESLYSFGESCITNFLNENSINFSKEKTFSDCRYKNPLRFDFYIPKYKLLIEYDGIHHFKPTFGQKEFEGTQRRDKIKNDWVKNSNKYRLIRIRYDQDLNKILHDIFINKKINKKELFVIWNK